MAWLAACLQIRLVNLVRMRRGMQLARHRQIASRSRGPRRVPFLRMPTEGSLIRFSAPDFGAGVSLTLSPS